MEMTAGCEFDGMVGRLVAARGRALVGLAKVFGVPLPAPTEAGRLAALKARAVAPEACGPEIPLAPARGAVVPFQPVAVVRGRDGYEVQPAGFAGRSGARSADAFDRMADQAGRAGGVDPFTPAQVATGRAYAALVERHAAFGLRGRSVEVLAGRGGGGSDGVMDAVIDEGRRIAAMERAAGHGVALSPLRDGAGRQAVMVLVLVRMVCVEGLDLSAVLRRHGWAPKGDSRAALRLALGLALDRMQKIGG